MTETVNNGREELAEGLEPRLDLADGTGERAARERMVSRLRVLWNKRQPILHSAVTGLVLSVIIAFLAPKRFESTTRLMPPDQMNSGMAMLAAAASRAGSTLGSLGGGIGGDLLGVKSSGALFVGIVQSRTVEDDLIGKFNLQRVYGDRYRQDARRDLDKHTDVSEDRKSGIITIRVTDKDPKRAAALAQEYVAELNRVVTQLNTSSAHRERVFLEERLVEVRQDLDSAEKEFSEFASKNTAIDIPSQGKAMIEAAATLEGQWIAAQTELESLKQMYADSNVRVRATQARVEELRRQLEKLGGKYDAAPAPSGPDSQTMYPSIRKLPLLGVNYADLFRKTKIQEAIYETLTQEFELAKVQEAKETPSVKVLDPPDVPEKKSFPPRLLVILFGTVVASSAGAAFALGNALWEAADPGDARKIFAQEVISMVKARIAWGSRTTAGSDVLCRRFWIQPGRQKRQMGPESQG
jgi:capsule polysaccharide export protein KpsE/RkpR